MCLRKEVATITAGELIDEHSGYGKGLQFLYFIREPKIMCHYINVAITCFVVY